MQPGREARRNGSLARPGLNPLRFSEKYTITEKHAQDLAKIAEVTGINGLRDLHRQEGFIAPLPEGVMEFGGKMFEISKDGTEEEAPARIRSM